MILKLLILKIVFVLKIFILGIVISKLFNIQNIYNEFIYYGISLLNNLTFGACVRFCVGYIS